MRNGKCPKCQSNKVGHLKSLTDDARSGTRAETLGIRLDGNAKWWQKQFYREGTLEGYVCTTCGYLETYVKAPETMPFEELEGFSWVDVKDDGPYR